MAELGNPADFVTLDTKILAQLSKVAWGELARQILTFKDVEAQNKRVVGKASTTDVRTVLQSQ